MAWQEHKGGWRGVKAHALGYICKIEEDGSEPVLVACTVASCMYNALPMTAHVTHKRRVDYDCVCAAARAPPPRVAGERCGEAHTATTTTYSAASCLGGWCAVVSVRTIVGVAPHLGVARVVPHVKVVVVRADTGQEKGASTGVGANTLFKTEPPLERHSRGRWRAPVRRLRCTAGRGGQPCFPLAGTTTHSNTQQHTRTHKNTR